MRNSPHSHTGKPKWLSAAAQERLKYVKVGPEAPRLDRFPDFLIVGPQRTGTTWLHANLRRHPELFFPEPKELFFFSRLKCPGDPRFRSDRLEWYLGLFRDPLWRLALKQLLALASHGRLYRPLLWGEATASYAALEEDIIEEITAINPDLRIVMMVRDPVERAWSHAKKDLVRNRGRSFEKVSDEEFQAFFRDEYQRRCARYGPNLDRWQAHLRPGHVFVGRFDDITVKPELLLVDVLEFIGVSSEPRYIGRLARRSINPTGSEEIPEKHRRFLEDLLAEEIRDTAERFGVGRRRPR